jgi:hypothetical protein
MKHHKFSITIYLLVGVFLVWGTIIYLFSDRLTEQGNYKTVHTDTTSVADTKLHLQFLTVESSKDPLREQLDPITAREIDENIKFSKATNLYNAVGHGEKLGTVQSFYVDEQLSLKITIGGIPDLAGTDYFEGWLIQNKPFRSVSLGRFFTNGAGWKLLYRTKTDYSGYPIVVVTREHDDGIRAPGDLVMEGQFSY